MGEKNPYQPLSVEDKITVMLYRAGIVLSSLIVASAAVFSLKEADAGTSGIKFTVFIISLYVSVGMSVFFIHLYISRLYKALRKLYLLAIASLAFLSIIGKGDIHNAFSEPYGPLLLIPLSGCLGFITAKEAFCFKLREGYILALAMPLYLLFLSVGRIGEKAASYGLILIAAMLIFFTLRKVFMPMHYDIGDKSAYT
jgi:uncharacterized integral membrane protein